MRLSDREWGEFRIDQICLSIKSGSGISEIDRKMGYIPYVSATSLNNGISDFIGNKNNAIDSNIISVNVNGSIGYSFFHKCNTMFSSDCKKLKLNKYSNNKYISLFICNQIMQQKDKYSYGYKMGKRLSRQIILLPTTPQGDPDYDFMEDYIKKLMSKKRQKYIEYVKEKMEDLRIVGGGGVL